MGNEDNIELAAGHTESAAGHVKPPKYFATNNGSSENVAVAWKLWLQQWEWYATATNIIKKSPEVQVAIFMSCIGPDAAIVYNTFNLTEAESKSLTCIKLKFAAYYTPKINETYERYTFNTIIQRDDQHFDEFITNLKTKVKNCGYGSLEESIIRDRVVVGIKSDDTREKLLAAENLTLQKTIDICHSAEQVKKQVDTMKQTATVEMVTCKKKNTKSKSTQNKKENKSDHEEKFHCGRCDTTHGRRACPAFKKTCKICKMKNHLTKCCKSKAVDAVLENSSEEDEDNFYVTAIDAGKDVDTEDWFAEALLPENQKIKFKLDSGSQCNVITKNIADRTKAEIRQSTTKYLTSFSNHKIPVKGEAEIETSIKGRKRKVRYIIVNENVTPILGKSTCVTMNLVKKVDSTLKKEDDIFSGIGCIKNYKYDIDLVDNPKLPICPARKIPHSIRQQVKQELDSMVEQEIIKPVTKPTPAVSPMVVVRKNNKIRLCIDPSEINKNLKRRYYPLNTVEEITARINGSKWFTLLDCRKGFWQLQVTPRTSEYLTFSTPFGRYSCLRMPFGLASAPEVFQQVMSSLTAGVKNTEVSMDDVLIHATTKEELEKLTEKVLNKFKKAGLKLNKEKCVFNTQEVKFLGHVVTSDGLKPDPEKLETISKIKRPENVKELQRFLGLVTYLSKFIENMADITCPLRQLLQKDVEWMWDHEQEEAFRKLKERLRSPPVLGYYDVKAPILLSVDASSYACGGVLIQKEKPIAYCAKSFTKTEQGYSQLEKETNAILVACRKFHTYIWGCKELTIESDHKPLETIFKKPLTEAPPRLQRMLYQILPYSPRVIYKKGSEMYVADTLSRDCENLTSEETNTENLQICAIVPFSKQRRDELKKETENSPELVELKKLILDGWPEKIIEVPENLKKYWYYRDELSVYNDIIFKNDRVLIPTSMVPLIMKHCHLSHKGIQGTLQLARDNVFWPTMTKDLTEYIQTCKACARIQKDNTMEPIIQQTVPERPWSIIATDLFHLKGREYIVIADAYSGYFDIQELPVITSSAVIETLKKWFATFGIPDTLQSDGGKQYDCEEFKRFSKEWKFEHRISSPHFPRSNGLAERYVQEAKTLMKKCKEDDTDVYLALLHHRNTPRLDLGSPCQRLMNRRTKTLLPINKKLLTPKILKNITKRLKEIKEQEKKNSDRGKKEIRKYTEGEKVQYRKGHQNWIPAKIIEPSLDRPRAYLVKTADGGTYTRNAWHLKHMDTPADPNQNLSTGSPDPVTRPASPVSVTHSEAQTVDIQTRPTLPAPAPAQQPLPTDSQRTTRSGRAVVTPARYL